MWHAVGWMNLTPLYTVMFSFISNYFIKKKKLLSQQTLIPGNHQPSGSPSSAVCGEHLWSIAALPDVLWDARVPRQDAGSLWVLSGLPAAWSRPDQTAPRCQMQPLKSGPARSLPTDSSSSMHGSTIWLCLSDPPLHANKPVLKYNTGRKRNQTQEVELIQFSQFLCRILWRRV